MSSSRQNLELQLYYLGWNPTDAVSGTGSISGKVFAVPGHDLNGVELQICEVAATPKCSLYAWYLGDAKQSSYTLKVPNGRYVIAALSDLNGNKKIDAGDYFGCYGKNAQGECLVFEVGGTVTGKDIQVEIVAGGGGKPSFSQDSFKPQHLTLPNLAAKRLAAGQIEALK